MNNEKSLGQVLHDAVAEGLSSEEIYQAVITDFLRRNAEPVAWQVRILLPGKLTGQWKNITESEFKTAPRQKGYEFRELFTALKK